MKYYTQFEGPFCDMVLVGNEKGLTNVEMMTGEGKRKFELNKEWIRNDAFFEDAKQQLLEYFAGKRTTFDLKLNPQGTDFQKKVWKALSHIPFGELRSYKDVATIIGNKNASRAVGMANSKNPIPLIIPCHRVVGSNGSMTGFAHGIRMKKKLIELENRKKKV